MALGSKRRQCYGVFFMNNKKAVRSSGDKDTILINSNGVYTHDKQGNSYYRGRLQTRIRMTKFYFDEAKAFWSKQTLNGQPMKLEALRVMVAANNTIPYNSPLQRRVVPQIVSREEFNRVAWYNVKFENGETGWVCNTVYFSAADAAHGIAVDTVHQIYNDKKVIACIKAMMEKQK